MRISRHLVAEAIAKKTLNIVDSKALAQEVAAYLLAEKRTSELESILRDIMQYRIDHGKLEAEVVSAHDVSNNVLEDVKQLLQTAYPKAETILITQSQDTDVIGGIKINMPNEQLDMTIKAKLSKFKNLTGVGASL